jgi:NAD(P)-dependent dehydrogenase (short-subunit alcohol dehydrogenase family)
MGRRDFDLSGARALVTGAGSGIGRAIALELARKGSHVLAVDQHGETAEKTALACREVGLTPTTAGSTSSSTTPGSA